MGFSRYSTIIFLQKKKVGDMAPVAGQVARWEKLFQRYGLLSTWRSVTAARSRGVMQVKACLGCMIFKVMFPMKMHAYRHLRIYGGQSTYYILGKCRAQ